VARRSSKKQKIFFRRLIVIVVIIFLIGISCLVYLWQKAQQTKMVTYTEFGIPVPANYAIHGIDVSRYQQRISWPSVAAMDVDGIRVGFVFIKATEGINNIDPYFNRNWKNSKDAGMIRGAYHFFVATKSGRMQALNFIKQVTLEPGDLPPVLDIENGLLVKPAVLQKEIQTWLDLVEQHYGVKPVIYTYTSFYRDYLQGHFDQYPLWVAHYLEPNQPRINRDWTFWQHSESGHVNGIVSQVDFNVFNGDSIRFRSLLIP
jgi:lysozyme